MNKAIVRKTGMLLLAAGSWMLAGGALACNDHAPGKEPGKSTSMRESPWIAGEVLDVDVTDRTITLSHGKIDSLRMDPMGSMLLKAENAKILAAAKPGDRIRFRVRVVDDQPIVTRLATVK